jgi:uncharacterized protein YbaP (TraB family)
MTKIKNSLLWELSSPSCEESSFLFGSIHLPDQGLFHRIPQVKAIIDHSSIFMAEYDLDENDARLHAALLLEHEGGLKALLGLKKYEKLHKQIKKSFGLDIHSFNHMKPMILEQVIASQLIDQPAMGPMDSLLWQYAKSKEKKLFGAESYESQVVIMESFHLDQQIKQLLSVARNPASYRHKINRVKSYYRDENIIQLYKTSLKGLGEMKRKLVYDRNTAIANSLFKQAQSGSVVCVVGAGHLSGYRGILRQLAHLGFALRPLPLEGQ